MPIDGEVTVYISMEDWINFIVSKSGGVLEDKELLLAPPRFVNGEMEVDVAFSNTEVHPKNWCGINKDKYKIK